jgi:hypothetical protein
MKFNLAVGLIVATPLLLSACSPQDVVETISTAQVCTEAAGIFIEIQEILVLAAEDPTALETHRIALTDLSEQFGALTPAKQELAEAHETVSASMSVILETLANPSAADLGSIPTQVAEAQAAALDFAGACAL